MRTCANKYADRIASEYANLSVCGEISCYMEFMNKKKDETERFGKKALFRTVLDFLLEPKNVRISYVCETHEVEFIMRRKSLIFNL